MKSLISCDGTKVSREFLEKEARGFFCASLSRKQMGSRAVHRGLLTLAGESKPCEALFLKSSISQNIYARPVKAAFLALLALFLSSPAFASQGLATYYTQASCKSEGTSGVRTASGERYDESAFTCALPSHSFGKSYRVTNLSTGKSAICRHNDYGPGQRPRARGVIVDLTPALFDFLGGKRGCKSWGCWGEMRVAVEALP